ncbi:MAG: hypothetical protein ACXV2C_04635 [Candidatus Bathyarchaeia archaeon]
MSGGLARMGKTVPSYRIALEFEIHRWKGFRNALQNDKEQQAFDEIMDMCRGLASAGSCATNPILFEPMVISILLAQQKKLRELEHKLNALALAKKCTQPQSEIKSKL